jgi:ABC-type Fe3+/spermidine/putrescine transport system ATPase subunit
VKELQQTLGLTTIFVTHDQDEALSMSDRVLVMSAGSIQQIGTPEEVYRAPTNRFVAEFVGRVNLVEGIVSGRDGTLLLVDVGGSARRLAVHSDGGTGIDARVTLAFRPEAVRLSAADDVSVNGTNTWEADVRAVAFLGDHYQYEVTVGSQRLTVQSLQHVPGERIKLHIPPEACSVVADVA